MQFLKICFFLFIFVCCAFGSMLNCAESPHIPKEHVGNSGLPKVKILLKWSPQFQFAGYYMAKHLGYYRDAGLDVEIIGRNPENAELSVTKAVLGDNGDKIDFGITNLSTILSANYSKKPMIIAALFQHSPEVLVSLKSSGISKPSDMIGRKVMLGRKAGADILAMIEKTVGIDKLNLVYYPWDINFLLDGTVDVMAVYRTNELIDLQNRGVEVNVFSPLNYDIDVYGDLLFTSKEFAQNNPVLIDNFIKASVKGWRYAFDNPLETCNVLHDKFGSQWTVRHLMDEMAQMRLLVMPSMVDIGHLSAARWEEITRCLHRYGIVDEDFSWKDIVYNYSDDKQFLSGDKKAILIISILLVVFLIVMLFLFNYRLQSLVSTQTRDLKINQDRLQFALDGVNDGLWDWDVLTDEVYFSPHCLKVFNYPKDALPTKNHDLLMMVHDEDRERVFAFLENFMSSGKTDYQQEFRAPMLDGSYRWILTRGKVYSRDKQGNITRMIGTLCDVTDKREKAEQLKNRIKLLTKPLFKDDDFKFKDIFSLRDIQALQDAFSDAVGISSLIVDQNGNLITQPSSKTTFCSLIMENHVYGDRICKETFKSLAPFSNRNHIEVGACKLCNLMTGVAPIYAGEKHLANWVIGQVLEEGADIEKIAGEISGSCSEVDFETIVSSLKATPVMPKAKFDKIGRMLLLFAQQLSELAFKNVVQARTIFERMSVEEKLLENEAILKEAQSIAHVGHWRYDVKNDILEGSEETARILKLDQKKLWSIDDFRSLILDDDIMKFSRSFDDCIERGESLNINLRISFGIEIKYVYLRGVVMGDDVGRAESILGIIQDISRQRTQELALKEQEENIRITLDSIGDGVIATDELGKIVRMNPVAQKLTGWRQDEAFGRPIDDVFNIFDVQTGNIVSNPIHDMLKNNSQFNIPGKSILIDKNGKQISVSENASLIKNENSKILGAVLVFRDITDQQHLEEQLRQAQKMEAIGQLAGGIAHDFNNLLGGIMGFAELINIKNTDQGLVADYSRQILLTAERAAALTSQMLAFARKGKILSTQFDLHECIESAIGILRHSIIKKIEIFTSYEADDSVINGDLTQIQNAVLNLGINARDAMQDGGRLWVSTKNITLNSAYCDNSTFKLTPGLYIQISVRDSGQGISPDDLGKIFEPFYTTKQVGEGTGLGLAAVFGTVTAHEGAITVESKVGEGTAFHILLPVAGNKGAELDTNSYAAIATEFDGTGKKVLIVDDEAIVRSMATALIVDAGYEVEQADNGREAVEMFKHNPKKYDVVILDMIMPVMDGLETLVELFKINPEVKVIVASGYAEDTRIKEMLLHGAKTFIQKPYRQSEMLITIHNVICPEEV